jgi:hypothetical protein
MSRTPPTVPEPHRLRPTESGGQSNPPDAPTSASPKRARKCLRPRSPATPSAPASGYPPYEPSASAGSPGSTTSTGLTHPGCWPAAPTSAPSWTRWATPNSKPPIIPPPPPRHRPTQPRRLQPHRRQTHPPPPKPMKMKFPRPAASAVDAGVAGSARFPEEGVSRRRSRTTLQTRRRGSPLSPYGPRATVELHRHPARRYPQVSRIGDPGAEKAAQYVGSSDCSTGSSATSYLVAGSGGYPQV